MENKLAEVFYQFQALFLCHCSSYSLWFHKEDTIGAGAVGAVGAAAPNLSGCPPQLV